MTAYQKFKKLKIDFPAIGFEPAGDDCKYFCTPIGANIIGRAGVDGIHYCFVRGQGEMVFAVNPSNEVGKNVFPIANTFADLLSLLLSCGGMAAIEQSHMWDEEQFEEFVAENQPTPAQLAVFDVLRDKLGITAVLQYFFDDKFQSRHYRTQRSLCNERGGRYEKTNMETTSCCSLLPGLSWRHYRFGYRYPC